MSGQPSAERIVCACWKDYRQSEPWSEWRSEDRCWWEFWDTVACRDLPEWHEGVPDNAPLHCRFCGARLWRPGEDPTHPEPHAGPSNAELCHELAVRGRALGLMNEAAMDNGSGWLDPLGFIAQARRQLEEEDRASLARQEGGGEC